MSLVTELIQGIAQKKKKKKKKRAEVKLFIRDPVFLLRKSWSPKLKTPLFQKQDEVDGNKRCF